MNGTLTMRPGAYRNVDSSTPKGTRVIYWPIRHEDGTLEGEPRVTTTRTSVQRLAEVGPWVVWLNGIAGCVHAEHVVIDESAAIVDGDALSAFAQADQRVEEIRKARSAIGTEIEKLHRQWDHLSVELKSALREAMRVRREAIERAGPTTVRP